MTLPRKLTIIASVAIVLGLAGTLPALYFWMQNRIALANPTTVTVPAQAPTPKPTPTLVTGKPTKLDIPSLKMHLTVADGVYNQQSGEWTLSTDKAHYALPTVQPNNEEGNTLIYGHYRPEVFAYLHLIKEGAEASVTTDNGYRFVYKYRGVETVKPSDTSIFAYQGKPQLTVQTCTGAWMQNRQLYYFSFVRYEKTKE